MRRSSPFTRVSAAVRTTTVPWTPRTIMPRSNAPLDGRAVARATGIFCLGALIAAQPIMSCDVSDDTNFPRAAALARTTSRPLLLAFIVTVQLEARPLHAPPQPERPQATAGARIEGAKPSRH